LAAELTGQFAGQGLVVPVELTDELLQALALLVVQVGDTLDILALQVGEQSLDVVAGVGTLLRREQGAGEGFEETLQTRQQVVQQTGTNLRVIEQLVQPGLIATFHDHHSPGRSSHPE
jgi:hypothetical protein